MIPGRCGARRLPMLLLAFAAAGSAYAAPKPAEPPKPAPPPPKKVEDVVRKSDGSEIRGLVSRIDADGLAITDTGGKAVTLKTEEFTAVTLGDTPPGLSSADRAISDRDFRRAAELCKSALDDVAKGKARPLHKPDILLKLAKALRSSNDETGALDTLRTLRSECGSCPQRRDAYREALEIARNRKDDGAIRQILGDMKNEPEPLKGEAEMEVAVDAYAKGEYAAAQQGFAAVASRSDSTRAPAGRAGVMRCLRALKKMDELEAICKTVLAGPSSGPLFLRQAAYASQGAIFLAKAEAGEKDKLREALHAFLKAVAIGPPAREEPQDDYAFSLMSASRCYVLLSQAATAPEARQEYKNWSTGYLTEVARSYRTTEWGKMAEKELGTGGSDATNKDGAGKDKDKKDKEAGAKDKETPAPPKEKAPAPPK
jgi:hypothetical protein